MRKAVTAGYGASSSVWRSLPSPDVCGPRGSSEHIQGAGVSGGVRQLR